MHSFTRLEDKKNDKSTDTVKPRLHNTNLTGIPDDTKERYENLSGFSLDDVLVHYNSGKPAELQTPAYTQGNQIHIATGQEKYLDHELGHVVQQKQGRVQADTSIGGHAVNANPALETNVNRLRKPLNN